MGRALDADTLSTMKRTTALALIVLLALTGCSGTAEEPAATPSASEESTPAATPSETAEESSSPSPTESSEDSDDESDDEEESDRAEVPWGDYAADLQPRIDGLTASADCAGLQAEFDAADANDDATRDRTGHGNTELMMYVDESLQMASCY